MELAKPKRASITGYVVIWVVLAGLALSYLALLATQPSILAGLGGSSSRGDADTSEVLANLRAEIFALNESIEALRRQIGDVRSEQAAQGEREGELNMRLASLEASATAPAATAAAAPARAVDQSTPKATAKDSKKEAAKAAAEPKKITAETAKPAAPAAKSATQSAASGTVLETGSVGGQSPFEFGPPTVTTTRRAVGIRLGSAPSVDKLRLSWSVLADQNADALKSLRPHYTTGVNGSDLSYELLAGPVSSQAEAKRICDTLVQQGNSCSVGELAGTQLQ